MTTVTAVAAEYASTGISRFDGNPFIEALPRLPNSKDELLLQLSNYPDKPTRETRRASEIVRIMEMSTLADVVYPFPEYGKSALDLTKILREAYVARNPLSPTDIQRRHALATNSSDGVPFPSDWKSSAQGHFMMGITGMGKSTFCNAFFLHYPQLIEHTDYHGQPLKARQIVYIVLSIPHDATLKGLCIQFVSEIDKVLRNTNYRKEAMAVRTVALMVQLMRTAATATSLGLVVIDDVQNLRAAKGPNAEYMLNLFSEILERLGISLFSMATPAVDRALINVVRNTRKSMSSGCVALLPMARNSPIWLDFCETYWEYMYVKRKKRLTEEIRNAWYDSSAGDTAFSVLSFMLTQENAIGNVEEVTAAGFRRTMATDMAILQPAIAALRSRKISELQRFDDLLFGKEYFDLMKPLKLQRPKQSTVTEEFDDVPAAENPDSEPRPTSSKKRKREETDDPGFPVEHPLLKYE